MSANSPQELDSEKLWSCFRSGDTDALAIIVRRFYQDLINYGSRFTADKELVKDALQTLFLNLWKNRNTINDTASVKNYLLKSLRHILYKNLRQDNETVPFEDTHFRPGFNIVLPVESNLVLQEKLTELTYKVRNVIGKLSKRQQEIIYLRFYMDADTDQIADIMSISRQSVYNLLQDAFNRFKSLSNPDYFDITMITLLLTYLANTIS